MNVVPADEAYQGDMIHLEAFNPEMKLRYHDLLNAQDQGTLDQHHSNYITERGTVPLDFKYAADTTGRSPPQNMVRRGLYTLNFHNPTLAMEHSAGLTWTIGAGSKKFGPRLGVDILLRLKI